MRVQLRSSLVVSLVFFTIATLAKPASADAPRLIGLRAERVGDAAYFRVYLEIPRSMASLDAMINDRGRTLPVPRLVPQDQATKAVYWSQRLGSLEFVGKLSDPALARLPQLKARFLLLYPLRPRQLRDPTPAKLLEQQGMWEEIDLTLDFSEAIVMREGRRLDRPWAEAQMQHFARLEARTPDFGFYGFAREATARKYGLPSTAGLRDSDRPFLDTQLYEITTGAAAITESLALHRMRDNNVAKRKEARFFDVDSIEGVTIAEHPWEKMMAGQKPTPEPLARLVPHDNYYLHFKNIVKFLEAGDLFDQWGTTLSRAMEMQSRDYQLKDRLERQLCLKSSKLTRLFGPAVVKSLAFTGSDPYLREGSDLTVIFHVANRPLFFAAVEPYLKEARAAFPESLKEVKTQYLDVAIESFVTPLREVSLFRASFDDYVVYSNSPAGIRRVLDTYKGKRKSLADSLDYQYMRTVFRLEDPLEDGFVFLSDPFLRNLVGPATRIKERRRLEALTSLAMVTNGALFTAWETGKLPTSQREIFDQTGLEAWQIDCPDGDPARWDAERQVAVSSFYNTMHFATPLIEIPIDRVTPSERQEYRQFRAQYLGLWREFFDPIGIRIKLGAPEKSAAGTMTSEVRWETYILPLVQSSQYNNLRQLAGDGTIKVGPDLFHGKTILQFLSHLSPTAPVRNEIDNLQGWVIQNGKVPQLQWLGNWYTLRLDDSPTYTKFVERRILEEMVPPVHRGWFWQLEQALELPWTFGVEIRNPLVFAGLLAAVKKHLAEGDNANFVWTPLKEQYKGFTLVEIKVRNPSPIGPAYYTLIDGAWFISLRKDSIHHEIDAALARKEAKAQPDRVDVNTSFHVAPKSAVHAREAIDMFLEWETHKRAMTSGNLLYPLYRCGLLDANADEARVRSISMKYLGFVPVSPDYSPYSFDGKADEMLNKRHGSSRQPRLSKTLDVGSPLKQLLDQLQTVRADLRFREDGVHTVIVLRK